MFVCVWDCVMVPGLTAKWVQTSTFIWVPQHAEVWNLVACSVAEQFVLIGVTFAPRQWQSTQQNSRLSSVDGALCFNQRRHATVAAAGQRRRTNGTSGISHLTRAVHANDRLYRAGSTMGICQRTAGYLMDIGAAPTACRRGFCGGGVVVLICGNLDRRKTGVANSRRIAFCSLRARGGLAHSADGGRFAPTARPLSAGPDAVTSPDRPRLPSPTESVCTPIALKSLINP